MKRRILSIVAFALSMALLLPSCVVIPTEMLTTAEGAKSTKPTETKEREETNMTTPAKPKDDVIDVLMIGNSWCYYYVEELFGMATAAGIKMRVCNVYYSGCTLAKHYNWYTNGEKNYNYFETYENGRVETKKVGLVWCLEQHDWDVVTLQNGSGEQRAGDAASPYKTVRSKAAGGQCQDCKCASFSNRQRRQKRKNPYLQFSTGACNRSSDWYDDLCPGKFSER